jgi:hypothetical protein
LEKQRKNKFTILITTQKKQNKMNKYFKVKVKFTKQLDNGTFKRVTETYLFQAVSFSDAESRVYDNLAERIRGEFQILAIDRFAINDVMSYDFDGVYYQVKVLTKTMDIDTEKDKKETMKFLILAKSIEETKTRIDDILSGFSFTSGYEISQVTISPIVEVFDIV